MSTSIKRPHAEALRDAEDFRALFAGLYARWEIAGSVRRGKVEVGDVEHVVMPQDVDAFWRRVDELTCNPGDMFAPTDAPLRRHVYPNGTNRWGEKYRGVDFRGFAHEIFLADALNFGSVLAIRTGPAEFSEMLVTRMNIRGRFRQQGGYVRYQASGAVFGVGTEQGFFEACGVEYTAPAERTI